MTPSLRHETELLVTEARSNFEGRDWWESTRREDKGKRAHVENMLREIVANCHQFGNGIESVRRMLARLDLVGEQERVVVGYSVGFKKPGPGKMKWANFPGCFDPMEASRKAAEREDIKELLRSGYSEYGISPLVKWEPKTPAADAEASSGSAPRP